MPKNIHDVQNMKMFNTDRLQPCAGTILPYLPHPKPSPGANKHDLHRQMAAWGSEFTDLNFRTEDFMYVLPLTAT